MHNTQSEHKKQDIRIDNNLLNHAHHTVSTNTRRGTVEVTEVNTKLGRKLGRKKANTTNRSLHEVCMQSARPQVSWVRKQQHLTRGRGGRYSLPCEGPGGLGAGRRPVGAASDCATSGDPRRPVQDIPRLRVSSLPPDHEARLSPSRSSARWLAKSKRRNFVAGEAVRAEARLASERPEEWRRTCCSAGLRFSFAP